MQRQAVKQERYLWEYAIQDIFRGELTIEVTTYYYQLQHEAEKWLNQVTSDSFTTVVAVLHGLEEKCSLLFYFLTHYEQLHFRSYQEMLQCIEAEYTQSYTERYEQPDSSIAHSLLYKIM